MASLLEVIDWDNLDSSELTTACKLLMSATQERFSLALMAIDEGVQNTGVSTFLYDSFDWGSNSPVYRLQDGDPLILPDQVITDMISKTAQFYADLVKIGDEIGSTSSLGTAKKTLSDTADDPGTYPNRLLEIAGYEDYPDFSSTVTTHEVKKWFDILAVMTHIFRRDSKSFVDPNGNLLIQGEFDNVKIGTAFTIGGAKEYGSDPPVTNATTTPWNDFITGHNLLFPGGADTDDIFNPSGVSSITNDGLRYNFRAVNGSTNYHVWQKSFTVTIVLDYAGMKGELGFTGLPLDYQTPGRMNIVSNSVESTFTAASFREVDLEIYYVQFTESWASDEVSLEIDDGITKAVIPSTIPAPTPSVSSRVDVQFDELDVIENWNGDGGFDYYTNF